MYVHCTPRATTPLSGRCQAGNRSAASTRRVAFRQCPTRILHPNARVWNSRRNASTGCGKRTADRVRNEAVLAANKADAEAVKWQLQRRLASLDDEAAVLAFGRIDEDRGDRWYIGRRHVEDERGTPVVVDWRAEVATPFYRATLADPFGLEKRRRFVFTGRELTDLFEEDFDDPDSMRRLGGRPGSAARRVGPGAYRADARHRLDHPGRAGRHHPRAARVVPRRARRAGHGQDRGRPAPRRVPPLRAPHVAVTRRRARRRAQPGIPALHLASAAVARRDVGDADNRRRVARTALSIARRRRPRRRGDQGRRADGDRRRTGRRRTRSRSPTTAYGCVTGTGGSNSRPTSSTRSCTTRAAEARRSPRRRERFRSQLVRRAYTVFTGGEVIELDEGEFGKELLLEPSARKAIDGMWKSVNAVGLVRIAAHPEGGAGARRR